ncbi:hypothetical protein LZ31DRAFT_105127 [Colletotrichum somersetense]|nr:hypothetical protein LZ31DRAFT_105127 [Colletotrichum somersetense]
MKARRQLWRASRKWRERPPLSCMRKGRAGWFEPSIPYPWVPWSMTRQAARARLVGVLAEFRPPISVLFHLMSGTGRRRSLVPQIKHFRRKADWPCHRTSRP